MEIAGLPYWEVHFDDKGTPVDDGQLPAQLPGHNLSDLFVFCHGWNNSMVSARDLYQAMFTLLSEQIGAAAPGRPVGVVGVFWPSLVFPEDDPTAPSVTVSTGQQLAEALAPVFQRPQQQALSKIGELLDTKPADSGKLREAHGLIRSLVTSPDLGATEDTGDAAVLTQPTAAVFGHFAGISETQSDADLGDLFNLLWGGAREALRVACYYEMKNRAGVIGRVGLGPLVSYLVPAGGGPRVHLLGHSFGARLVAFALSGLPADRRGAASPVKSLTLIQGAFSHFSFAQPIPIDAARNGALTADRNGVDGPLLATFSAADRALGWWYPAASLLSHSDGESAQDLTYRWGAMGHDGYQQQDAMEIVLQQTGKPYAFAMDRFYRLKSDAVIAADQSPFAGAHSDIRHPEILWAVLAAAVFTDAGQVDHPDPIGSLSDLGSALSPGSLASRKVNAYAAQPGDGWRDRELAVVLFDIGPRLFPVVSRPDRRWRFNQGHDDGQWLYVLLLADAGLVRPMGAPLWLPAEAPTEVLRFDVTPTRPGPLVLRFRVFLQQGSLLLQELTASVTVASQPIAARLGRQ